MNDSERFLEKGMTSCNRHYKLQPNTTTPVWFFCTSENDLSPSPPRRITLLIMCDGARKLQVVFLRRKGVQITSQKRPAHTRAVLGGGSNGKATPNGGSSHRHAEKGACMRVSLEPCMIIENLNITRLTVLQTRLEDGEHQEGPLVRKHTTSMRHRL